MSGDGAEPKARPLRVPVSDVPVRNSIVAPEPEPGFSPMRSQDSLPQRPSVVSHQVRVVSDAPPASRAESHVELDLSEDLDMNQEGLQSDVPMPPAPAVPQFDEAVLAASHDDPDRAASDAPQPDPGSSVPGASAIDTVDDQDVDLPDVPAAPVAGGTPRATLDLDPGDLDMEEASATSDADDLPSASDTLDLEPVDLEAATDEGDEGMGRASLAQPPPPPERMSQAQPPPPPASTGDADIDVTPEEEQSAVVIDLTEDEEDVPPPPPVGRLSGQTPPPPPPTGRMSGAAHRVADLKPSKPRKHHWWEAFFDDDYLRSVRMPSREAIARKADFIEKRLGLVAGATVLDVGCGWGVDVVELSARGYLGVGMDLSLAMLSRAADEAQDRGQRINFLHADMREMNFDGTFDAVMCLGTTLGYFDDEMNRQVIERLHRALKPQGVLLIETVNRDHVIKSQPNLVWFEGDGCVCMEESEFNYFTSRLHVKRTVILDDGKQRENEYSVRLYSLHELGQMLHHQGFRVTEVSGRLAVPGVFFGQESPTLLVVAERRADGTDKHSAVPAEPEGTVG